MKLILENWREYLNERVNLDQYEIVKVNHPNAAKRDWGYATTKFDKKITLREKNQGVNLLQVTMEVYNGYVGHTDIRNLQYNCQKSTEPDINILYPQEQSSENIRASYEARDAAEKAQNVCYEEGIQGFKKIENLIIPGGFFVEIYLSKYLAGSLALAFFETLYATIRDDYKSRLTARHEVSQPAASTTPEMKHMLETAVKRGWLVKTKDFLPEIDYTFDDEYEIYEITDIPQKRF